MTRIYLFFIQLFLLSQTAIGADEPKTNQWGATAGGLKMALSLAEPQGSESNGPPVLIITVTNLSEISAELGRPMVGSPIWFSISSPSGKDLSSAEPGMQRVASAITLPIVNPHESLKFKRQLHTISSLEEAGSYTCTAKVRVFVSGTNFVLSSNPLIITLSESEIKHLPKPPSGF